MHVVEVRDGELIEALTAELARLEVRRAAVVALIGAADTFRISTMPADDATSDVVTDYEVPAEMAGTGEVVDGVPHLHVVMGVAGDQAVAGHLHRAWIGTHFARAYVMAY